MSLHNAIMNIPVNNLTLRAEAGCPRDYKLGHRDARHAAAELSLKYDALLEELSGHFGTGIVDMFKRKVGL
ncbi:hypothetical protein uav_124 [Pseudomonas phage UAVern]|uniref:Uncharacterized protein n=1 Tax=Pseudomonas phage UAVern TaxID=2856997 RepID=A0A975UY46_9CAUD|nr:hypothetical protein uav_124 [Pseudomonas phage UAVern]